jgi:glutaredoxin
MSSSSQQPPPAVEPTTTTTNELGTPIVKNTTTNVTPDTKYVKREITMVGFDDCGHCVDAETYFKTELIPTSDVPVDYKKIIADSDEGKKIVEEKGLEFVPYVKECLIPKDPNKQPDCQEMKSFKKSKFKSKVNSD